MPFLLSGKQLHGSAGRRFGFLISTIRFLLLLRGLLHEVPAHECLHDGAHGDEWKRAVSAVYWRDVR